MFKRHWESSKSRVATATLSATVTAIITGAGCVSAPDAGRTGPPVATGTAALTATRPSYNTGVGFFASGGRIFDANGNEFIIRGTNYEVWPDPGDQTIAINGMTRAKLNAARLNFPAGTYAGTEAANAATVQRFVDAGIVPIAAVWVPSGVWPDVDAPDYQSQRARLETTCSTNSSVLTEAVDNWVGPQKNWLISQERYVILNIANEWGEADASWRDNYIQAITRIRAAGIKAMIMIDAGGFCGQNAQSIESYGTAILNADPQHNVVFSVHMYAQWTYPGAPNADTYHDVFPNERQPYDMNLELGRLVATNLPVVVGEYCGWQGGGDGTCQYPLTGSTGALTTYEARQVGYMSWEWRNGNTWGSLTRDGRYDVSSDLYPYGATTIEDPTLGSQVLAQKATVFGGGAPPPASDSARYNFESGTQGWLTFTPGITLARSATQKFAGGFALADSISATGAQIKSSQVDNPTTPAGATVTTHVWCPAGAAISSVTAWVQNGGTANGACPAFQWTGQTVSIVPAQWNTIAVTVPPCSLSLAHLGVDFTTSGAWTGTCYTDTVNW